MAISVYVLVAILKKRLELDHSLYTILQILSVTVFEKQPITEFFSDAAMWKPEVLDEERFPLFAGLK